ncbi:glycine betaine/L-proline ABC transporter substrate-binding protein ProX [Roseofilum sp. BLCC_M154]|uniref:Glycine betaine/L-proline ABC transporter substrate-binding protein ProX n=1 Tax=Roseofilum acuticapitatum BLCC-M154 TaxID=3022444 RepID=A0ABT7AVD6_9CYAN|nr:glycine betaine/L-proline ABC transporter substrate-binding protein ProX [Roseofilum acuticapitatum]MDJ1170877.1 glycine betaine/L-proline ABC transporter substrate-binding protein ProX [Roseofilum acuticapitatum BLCC-M154]
MASKSLFISTVLSLGMALTGCDSTAPSRSNLSPEDVTIRSAHSTWLDEIFQTEVVNIGLEQLGYQIAPVKRLEYPGIYLSLANGDLDYSVVYYSPSHDGMLDQAGGEEKIQKLGVFVPIGNRGYQIDRKTAEEYGITNLAQLKDPDLAKLFDWDGDGKANLAGCNPGWGCASIINHHIEVYGLQETVEQEQSVYEALLDDGIRRYQEGQSILFYAYNPHWISAMLRPEQDTIWLEVPFTSLPENEELSEAETTFNGKNTGFPGGAQEIVLNPDFAAANPVAKRWLELVQFSLEDISEVSLQIKEGEDSPEKIRLLAEEWIAENQEEFDRWIEEAKAAGE